MLQAILTLRARCDGPERLRYHRTRCMALLVILVLGSASPCCSGRCKCLAGGERRLAAVARHRPVLRAPARRSAQNICHIRTAETEVDSAASNTTGKSPQPSALALRAISSPNRFCISSRRAAFRSRFREASEASTGDYAAVDSELTLLVLGFEAGEGASLAGPLLNPFFGKREAKFAHPEFPMYLVTRLAAYDLEGVKAIIDRSMHAANRGKFVIDMKSPEQGGRYLAAPSREPPAQRPRRLRRFGKSDLRPDRRDRIRRLGLERHNRHRRFLGFHWLPGAIATEFVSTNGRTFQRPPDDWNISDWKSQKLWFAGAPQTPHCGLFARRRYRRHRSRG